MALASLSVTEPAALLREPGAAVAAVDTSTLKQIERTEVSSERHYQRFVVKDKQFDRQFSHMYARRTLRMSKLAQQAARRQWGDGVAFKERIIDLEVGEEGTLVGTLYKEMAKKPCVLDEYEEGDGTGRANDGDDESAPAGPPPIQSFASDSDSLVLEDGSGRVPLKFGEACAGGDPTASLVTGVVVAVQGRFDGDAAFQVSRWTCAGIPPQSPRASSSTSSSTSTSTCTSSKVVLVSGLHLGKATAATSLAMQLMIDYIGGHVGSDEEQGYGATVGRVIVAGNSVQLPKLSTSSLSKRPSREQQDSLAQPLHQLDVALAQLAAAVPVDVMPGGCDPATHALPQQPLHACLFPHANRHSGLSCVTNPHDASLKGVRIVGHAGQPTDDLQRCSTTRDPLELLESTLRWQHMAPTAPDTLACYPFRDADPFILDSCPHVYFTANQREFGTKVVKGEQGQEVRLISVPSFAATGTIAVLDLDTLECHPVAFAMRTDEEAENGGSTPSPMDESG